MKINNLTNLHLTKTVIAVGALSILLSTTALAQTSTSSGAAGTTASDKMAQKQAAAQQRLETKEINLKTRADNEITRRITALNNLITRINSFKRLTADQKSNFTSQIQTEITNLTNLKAKIDADTDAATLKADVQSIVTEYRVFAFYIPQIRLLETSDRILNLAEQMSIYSANLQTRITQAQANGQDVTALTNSLTDMQTKIADAKPQAQNVITTISALTPAGYPGNKTTLQGAKTSLNTARTDLIVAKQDARSIIIGLKTVKKQSTPTIAP